MGGCFYFLCIFASSSNVVSFVFLFFLITTNLCSLLPSVSTQPSFPFLAKLFSSVFAVCVFQAPFARPPLRTTLLMSTQQAKKNCIYKTEPVSSNMQTMDKHEPPDIRLYSSWHRPRRRPLACLHRLYPSKQSEMAESSFHYLWISHSLATAGCFGPASLSFCRPLEHTKKKAMPLKTHPTSIPYRLDSHRRPWPDQNLTVNTDRCQPKKALPRDYPKGRTRCGPPRGKGVPRAPRGPLQVQVRYRESLQLAPEAPWHSGTLAPWHPMTRKAIKMRAADDSVIVRCMCQLFSAEGETSERAVRRVRKACATLCAPRCSLSRRGQNEMATAKSRTVANGRGYLLPAAGLASLVRRLRFFACANWLQLGAGWPSSPSYFVLLPSVGAAPSPAADLVPCQARQAAELK